MADRSGRVTLTISLCAVILIGLAFIYEPPPAPEPKVDVVQTVDWQRIADSTARANAALQARATADSAAAVEAGRRARTAKARADSLTNWIVATRSDTGTVVVNAPHDTTQYMFVKRPGIDENPHGVPMFVMDGVRELQFALTEAVNKQVADSLEKASLRQAAIAYWRGSLQRDSVIRVRDERILTLHADYRRRSRVATVKAGAVGASFGFLLSAFLDAIR